MPARYVFRACFTSATKFWACHRWRGVAGPSSQRQPVHDVVGVDEPGVGEGSRQALVFVLSEVPFGEIRGHAALDSHDPLAVLEMRFDQMVVAPESVTVP